MRFKTSVKWAAKIKFPPEYNLPVREKKPLEQAALWHEVNVVCCLSTPLCTVSCSLRETVARKISIWVFPFTYNKNPLQFADDKSNDSSRREGIPLDALNWFERGYELHSPKSVGSEGSKPWALSVVPHFSLSPPRLAFLAWGDFHARSRFARSTIPKEKWGLLVVYPDKDFELRTKIEISRQVRRRQSTGRDSRCFGWENTE